MFRDKVCVVCGGLFTPKSGRSTVCGDVCRLVKNTANQARWHGDHPESVAAAYAKHLPKHEQWLIDNRDRVNATTAAWRKTNADSWAAYMQEWRENHRENARAYDSARRTQLKLSLEDQRISIAYRKAIANDPCFYCGKRTSKMHTDHFFPLKKGGTNHWWNLVRSCQSCNDHKAAHCGTWFLLKVEV